LIIHRILQAVGMQQVHRDYVCPAHAVRIPEFR
jgi:hypothetical protein